MYCIIFHFHYLDLPNILFASMHGIKFDNFMLSRKLFNSIPFATIIAFINMKQA
jgi:hypothetical protein